MTSFGGYLRGKICGVIPSRRAKTVPSRAFGRFQEFPKALKIPGKQESEIILPWEKKRVVQKKYLYLDRAIGDNNGNGLVFAVPRQPLIYRKRSNASKQEFFPGYRIKISEKTVTHDNAFFNAYFIKWF